MAASVRIEDEAFNDDRIAVLGDLLGTSRYDALGRLAYLWRQATAMGSAVLSDELVARHVDPDKLIKAGLGARHKCGVLLRGASDRVMWLKEKREAGKENGKKGAQFGSLGGRPRKTPKKPGMGVSAEPSMGVRENPPPAPAPAPAPARSQILPPARMDPTENGVVRRVWGKYLDTFNRLRPADMPPMQDRIGAPGERLIAALMNELKLEYQGDLAQVEGALLYALRVAEAEADDSKSVRWLDQDMWQPHRFAKLRTRTPGESKADSKNKNEPFRPEEVRW